MKIGVSSIVKDHVLTIIRDAPRNVVIGDALLFLGFPLITASYSYAKSFSFDKDGYNVSITFFGIFVALLLNIQVAIFSIFQRKWSIPANPRVAESQRARIKLRQKLLGEINANISYLTFICCVSLILSLLCYLLKLDSTIASSLTVFLYGHFLLTLLMIVKRSHVLFQTEYDHESP